MDSVVIQLLVNGGVLEHGPQSKALDDIGWS